MDKQYLIHIVEDQILIAEGLKQSLEEFGYVISGISYNYQEALQQLKQDKPDLVLIDISLGEGKSGIDLAKEFQVKNIPFVFLSSHKDIETINKATEVHPNGYLVKPIDPASLMSTIEVALSSLDTKKEKDFFTAKDGFSLIKIYFQDIKWIESDKQYVEVVCTHKKHVLRLPLKEIINKVPPKNFIQVHKSYIVNINKCGEIKSNMVKIENQEIPVGRKYKNNLKAALNLI